LRLTSPITILYFMPFSVFTQIIKKSPAFRRFGYIKLLALNFSF